MYGCHPGAGVALLLPHPNASGCSPANAREMGLGIARQGTPGPGPATAQRSAAHCQRHGQPIGERRTQRAEWRAVKSVLGQASMRVWIPSPPPLASPSWKKISCGNAHRGGNGVFDMCFFFGRFCSKKSQNWPKRVFWQVSVAFFSLALCAGH